MKKKAIEQAVAKCWPTSRERLLADKDFLHFMRYFPAGIGDEVKRYFNQVATGSGNFFMVPDREDKQKAVCSRCGKHIVLTKSSHMDYLKDCNELGLSLEDTAVLNGINKLLEHLDKVQDGKRGAGVCKALTSALAQSQNQITKRLAKFEQEA